MLKKILLGMALTVTMSAFAQKEGPAAIVNPKEQSESAELLNTAGRLVQYGYETKTALPLIQAVEIYNRLGVKEQAREKTSESDAVTAQADNKTPKVSYDRAKILADATQFADGDQNLLALVKTVGETRGNADGEVLHSDRVKANSTDVYTMVFRGGQTAEIGVCGDGDTDLDLYVYDENGNLITYDTDAGDVCYVTFTPSWTGTFRVKIKNHGRVYNDYVLVTN